MSSLPSIYLSNESATLALGAALGKAIGDAGGVITLDGELGAGKTCLARSLIQAMGHSGRVVSPSYTLMEPYAVMGRTVYHLDLYRLADVDELAFLGIRDINITQDLMLVEWPGRGGTELQAADLAIELGYLPDGPGRRAEVQASSGLGRAWWQQACQDMREIT